MVNHDSRSEQSSVYPDISHGHDVGHSQDHGHGQEHEHGHVKLKRYAKVLILMECPWSLYAYYFRYMLGVKGSFYTGFQTDLWIFYTNISIFFASLLAVILAVITDSYFQKYTVLVLGFLLSMISCCILFAVSIFKTGQYEKMLNTIGLFWGMLFITVEPLRVAMFFDQLPNKMDPHTTAHVFLMYQEMKTFGSVLYTILNLWIGGKVYGKTPLSLAIIYFAIPVVYLIVIVAFWKVSDPGETSYMVGVDCITCLIHALHLKVIKQVKQDGHWMDVARDAYDAKTVRSTKIMCSLAFVFTTLISSGMATTLQKSSWNDQSKDLIENLYLKNYYLGIDTVFFVLTLAMVPFIEYVFLPQIYKRRKDGKWFTELQRIGITVFLTGAAFVATTILQLEMEKYSSLYPSGNRAQVRIFNVQSEQVWVSGNWVFGETNISATNMIQAWNVKSKTSSLYTIKVRSEPDPLGNVSINFTSLLATAQGESISYMIGEHELLRIQGYDPIIFGPQGTNQPDMVRVYFVNYFVSESGADVYVPLLYPGDQVGLTLIDKRSSWKASDHYTIKVPAPFSRTVFQVFPGVYKIVCPPERNDGSVYGECIPHENVTIQSGGIYAILPLKKATPIPGTKSFIEEQTFKLYTICNPSYYTIYLMLPQVFLQSFAIAMGKVPINVFMFKESPVETRVSTLALYYFSQDGSSIIFAIFSEVFRFHVDSFQLVLVTGIHMVFCFFFTFAALRHQKFPEDDGLRRRRALIGRPNL